MTEEPSPHRQSRLFTTDEGEFDERKAKADALPVEDGELVNTDELADHQEYVEGRGVYDARNRVNDLTGREWKFATKSVIPEQYPPDLQHDLRSRHGGQKPPRLCLDLVQRFSKAGETVLDPFAGVGGTLLGASLAEYEGTGLRDAVGFERNPRWIDVYEEVLERENADRDARGEGPLAEQDLRCGDCADLVADVETDAVDFLLTDVPYWNMDQVEQTRNERETRDSKLGEFGDDGYESKAEWLDGMAERFRAFRRVVREGGYVAVFIGDMYRDESYEMLSAELASRLTEAGYTMKANLVWYDPSKDLHVYGYPFSFVPSMVHQNILVFRNE
ncbi:DNA methyltransferase [Salinirarus marinus]|uniref:DNA methyltransferase n=1 Tax=Salinirarus marinus TaxID=3068310 RepID=UPI003C6BDC37